MFRCLVFTQMWRRAGGGPPQQSVRLMQQWIIKQNIIIRRLKTGRVLLVERIEPVLSPQTPAKGLFRTPCTALPFRPHYMHCVKCILVK